MSNGCPQVEALDRQTRAIEALTDEIRSSREAVSGALHTAQEKVSADLKAVLDTIEPGVTAIAELGGAQKKLCAFIVKNRLKISLGIVSALLAVGAISPNAAEMLRTVLQGFGG